MFTGIIEDIGTIKNITDSKISIETRLTDISIGDSVAVNGVCLTAISFDKNIFTADYSPQTDKISNLSSSKQGEKVNLERALQLSSRLGGHIVSGHVDGKGKIEKIENVQRFFKVVLSCDESLKKYCVDKGSVALDGVSLTVSNVLSDKIEVFIIPETFNKTIFKLKKAGDYVNIETDILAKYIEKFTNNKNSNGITLEMLKGNGFI